MSKSLQEEIRSKYGDVASSSLSNDNAGVRAVAQAFGYTTEELASLPAEANMGLSCGNPTAMANLKSGEVVVDLGCGGGLDVFLAAQKIGPQGKAIGIDMTPSMIERAKRNAQAGLDGKPYTNVEFHLARIDRMPLPDSSVDIVVSRSVVEHLRDPLPAYWELSRILKPDGYFVFLTPNLWDYAALFSRLIPNRFHASIVRRTEGRDEADTFPTWYRSNTVRTIARLAAASGFRVVSCQYLVQYPNYLRFSTLLFLAGAAYAKMIGRIHQLRHLRPWILAVLQKNQSHSDAWRTPRHPRRRCQADPC